MRTIFIAGTDTNVGKTWVSCAFLKACKLAGETTIALKPLATGCDINNPTPESDLAQLAQASNHMLTYKQMAYATHIIPCSPNLCLPEIQAKSITEFCLKHTQQSPYSITLIEGIGGWLCPLNDKETMADAILPLGCPIVLVVGVKLGCLNHTLLTVKHMQQHQANLVGWIANSIDPGMEKQAENIAYLKRALPIPCLATIKHGEEQQAISQLQIYAAAFAKQHSHR